MHLKILSCHGSAFYPIGLLNYLENDSASHVCIGDEFSLVCLKKLPPSACQTDSLSVGARVKRVFTSVKS